jgi:hypothetical protein
VLRIKLGTELVILFKIIFMLMTEKSLALEEAVHQMGFNSVEDFALVQAKEKLLEEITECTSQIEKFEGKYGVDYADFCSKFHQLRQPVFEKEEDSAEWNAEIKQLHILNKRLAKLS